MHDFKAKGKILLEVELITTGQFNENYRSINEASEDALVEELTSSIPSGWVISVKDVVVTDCEQTKAKKE